MVGKGVRAGGTMNVCIAVLLCFALLGALDEGSGGRLGVAEAFRQGLSSMGSLCFSMAGIYCIAVTALPGVAEKAGEAPLPFDSSLLPGMLLAPDMGGWASAAALASTPELAVYAGLLVASTLGCLVSFVLPVSLGTLQYQQAMEFMQGIVWGIIALPAGLVLGALILKIAPGILLKNLWPVMALCAILSLALRFAPLGCARVLGWFGAGVRWLGVLLFCWMTWGLFVPERSVMPPDVVEEVLVIILKITIIVCGSLVAGRLVLAKCSRWLEWAASRLGVNEYAVLGLLTSLVSSVSMLPLYPRMDARGRMINGIRGICIGRANGLCGWRCRRTRRCSIFCNKAGRRFIGFDIGVLLCEKYGSSIHNRYIRNAGSKIIQELTFAGGCAERKYKKYSEYCFSAGGCITRFVEFLQNSYC